MVKRISDLICVYSFIEKVNITYEKIVEMRVILKLHMTKNFQEDGGMFSLKALETFHLF